MEEKELQDSKKDNKDNEVEETKQEDAEQSSAANENSNSTVQEEKTEKKKFFGKKQSKQEAELAKKEEQIQELNDRYKRLLAEFENARKRTEKESARMYDLGAKDVLEKLLPVIDNFERGLAAVTEEEKESSFVQGIDKIYKQFMKYLEEVHVVPMNPVGKEFDPELHNAVMHTEEEEMGENIVVEEFQKGYKYKDTVLRHSMVKVVN